MEYDGRNCVPRAYTEEETLRIVSASVALTIEEIERRQGRSLRQANLRSILDSIPEELKDKLEEDVRTAVSKYSNGYN